MAQALALENAEEQLHLIDPRRVLGRVVEEEAMIVAGVEGTPPAAPWPSKWNQTFSTTYDRSAESDFSGGISGLHH